MKYQKHLSVFCFGSLNDNYQDSFCETKDKRQQDIFTTFVLNGVSVSVKCLTFFPFCPWLSLKNIPRLAHWWIFSTT